MKKHYVYIFLTILAVIALVISFPSLHDYKLYIIQWEIIASGKKLPNYDNAYGVLHYLFTPFSMFYNQIPKLIFIGFYLYSTHKLYNLTLSKNGIRFARISLLILLLNPLFWIFGVMYGSNDLFVASSCFLSIVFYFSKKTKQSALFLFMGITYKFSPIFILPFLGIEERKINFKYFFTIGIAIVILYLFGYIIWENSIFNPFVFGSSRSSKLLSIFAFINSSYAPLSFINIYNIDFLSVYFMLFSWLILFLLYIYYKLDKLIMIFVSFSSILLFYKVGHHQFYFSLLFINLYIFSIYYKEILQNKALLFSSILFWFWLFLMTFLYYISNGYKGNYHFLRELVGGPTFIIHASMNLIYLRFAFQIKSNFNKQICN
jgi:hypothetical protein